MRLITTGARAGTAAAFALGLTLSVPHGVACADTPGDNAGVSVSDDAAPARGQVPQRHAPSSRGSRVFPARGAAEPESDALPAGRARSGAARAAAVQVPTARSVDRSATQVAAATAAPRPSAGLSASATAAPAVLPAEATVLPAAPGPAGSFPVPAEDTLPTWLAAIGSPTQAPTLVHSPALDQQLRGTTSPVERLIDSAGTWLADLPVTPVTDFLSGALWLTRRTLVPGGSGLGNPAACGAKCTSHSVGQVLTVTNRVDGQPGSLRDVLSTAVSGDVIRFAPALRHATLKLTQGELDIDVSVSIEGTKQTLDANGLSRIMRLDQPGTSISLSGLNFANGAAPGDPTRATMGGAILADNVTLAICGSRFSGNSAAADEPTLPGSSFMQAGLGGAIAAFGSAITISDSDFHANTAAGADNDLEQQSGSGLGGAIFAEDSEIVLLRSRFSGNSALGGSGITPIEPFPSTDGGWGSGGAVFALRTPVSATSVTFQRNAATGGDGLDGSASNPFGNEVGEGGRATGGALWIQGLGRDAGDPIVLDLKKVVFQDNSATGGSAGAQGLATLAGKQGGRGLGGGIGVVQWVQVGLDDVTFQDNLAQGGGAGPNAPDAGPNTGTGGVAQGGAAFLESPATLQATRLAVRKNTARGGTGADSAPDSGTEAGEGGFAYGGGVLVSNGTGSFPGGGAIIEVGIREADIVGNRVLGGTPGQGPRPDALGYGGLAQGGGLIMLNAFESHLVGLRFIGNSTIAGQGKSAYGGGLMNPFGEPRPGETARLQIQNSLFRSNTVVSGDDAAEVTYRESSGGGFYNNGVGTVISGTRFQGNSAVGGNDTGSGHVSSGLGGAIYSIGRNPSISIFNTAFADNSALGGRRLVSGESTVEPTSGEGRGGAIYGADGTIDVNGGSFVRNRAIVRVKGDHGARGGAIDAPAPEDGYVNYLNTAGVRFVGNVAASKTGVGAGGAIAFGGDHFVDNGSTFIRNSATSGRAGGSAYGGALLVERATELNGTAVTHNRASAGSGYGGGVALPLGPDALTQVQTNVRFNRARTAGNDLWWPTA